ncbi:MAG: hypothetical protein J6U27_01200 [Spirochaetales bacterium]|nr:hypothetical protein [Spirochaetales bacterium]
MSEPSIFTYDELVSLLKETVSEKRFVHSLGVAQTSEDVLKHFSCTDYEKHWKGFEAPLFCGIVHDLAREKTDEEILSFCRERGIFLPQEDVKDPVLAHGTVSAEIAYDLVGQYPFTWYKALCVHTTGNAGMDDLALSLFVADFIEPSRRFMTPQRRDFYLSSSNLCQCAYRVLCDMISHWKEKGAFQISVTSIAMKESLERRGCTYE